MKIIDGAIVLSFLTALLYCASTAYTHGFLGTLNLDTDVLSRDLHGILYHGMILCLHVIIIGPMIVLALSLLRSFIITDVSRVARSHFGKARKISKWVYYFSFRPKRKRNVLQQQHFELNFFIFKIVIFLLAFVFLMAYLEKKGKSQAKLLLDNIKSESFVKVRPISSEMIGLAYLYCGSRNCAGLNPANGEIYYFPQEGHTINRF